jgi:hypothetical protein
MPQDPRARALLIHVVAYAVVIAICAGVNLWLNPEKLWFAWVSLGWGIGVAAHGLAYWLGHAHRRERIFVDRRARGFTVHLFGYAAVVILLFVVNLTATPHTWWFYWVALGWGAGVALHGWAVLGRRRPGPDVTEKEASAATAPKPKRRSSPAKKQTTASKERPAPRKKRLTPRKRPTPKT